MILRPPSSPRTDTLLPYPPLFRSKRCGAGRGLQHRRRAAIYARRLGRTRARTDGQRDARDSAAVATQLGRGASFAARRRRPPARSEEHTSELQSLMRISYSVFRLEKKKTKLPITNKNNQHPT